MKNLQKLFAVLILGLTLVVTGCATDEAADTTADNTATPEQEAEQATDAAAEAGDVAEKNVAVASWVNDPDVIQISVPDAQCESCSEAICKAVDGVGLSKACAFDLTTNTAYVKVTNASSATEMQLEAAIAGSGYSTANMAHNEDAFNALPDCCKPGGMDDHGKADAKTKEM